MSGKQRLLNPMADVFVRYLLGSEDHKDILIDFLNAVFAQKVDRPEYVMSEHLQIHFIELPKNQLESTDEI